MMEPLEIQSQVNARAGRKDAGTSRIRSPRAGWWGFAAAALLLGVGVALVPLAPDDVPGHEATGAEDVVDMIGALAFAFVGALVLARRPGHAVGTAMVAIGVAAETAFAAGAYADAVILGSRDLPGGAAAQLLSSVAFVVAFALLPLVIALYPTGAVPSRRLRWLPPLWAGAVVAEALVFLLRPGPLDEDVPALGTNPLGVEALDDVLGVVEAAVLAALVLVVLGALVSLVVRMRRGAPAERRALRPFLPVAVLWVAASTVDGPLDDVPGYGVASALVLLAAFPLAVWAGLVRRPPEPTAGQVLEVSANPVR